MQKHMRSVVFAVALAAIAVIIVATWAPGSARAQQRLNIHRPPDNDFVL